MKVLIFSLILVAGASISTVTGSPIAAFSAGLLAPIILTLLDKPEER